MTDASIVEIHLMLEAGILPVLPTDPCRLTNISECLGTLSKAQRRQVKRRYRKLVRRSGGYLLSGLSRARAVNDYLISKM